MMRHVFSTALGALFEGDCLDYLSDIESDSADLIFCDPPFNLDKQYEASFSDLVPEQEYLGWCRLWLDELSRILAPGGAFFLWNLPSWNIQLAPILSETLVFRNWIAVNFRSSFPIKGRLYPAHYSLLYFVKVGKPRIFRPDRLPLEICRHCEGVVKDYGGYLGKLNPKGISLSDVWTDIAPVRHRKYKHRRSNALPLKLLDRIICMSSDPGSLVLDPFGGSGTTYVVSELLGRRWMGCDLDCSSAVERLKDLGRDSALIEKIHSEKNSLYRQQSSEARCIKSA